MLCTKSIVYVYFISVTCNTYHVLKIMNMLHWKFFLLVSLHKLSVTLFWLNFSIKSLNQKYLQNFKYYNKLTYFRNIHNTQIAIIIIIVRKIVQDSCVVTSNQSHCVLQLYGPLVSVIFPGFALQSPDEKHRFKKKKKENIIFLRS